MEDKELKVKELIALRGHYFSAVLIISSGIAGLFFANVTAWKAIMLLFSGLFFDVVFLDKFFKADNEIKYITGGLK